MWIVEDLESSIDIVDLVSKYTKLKKSGANHKALCPFPGHNEKTPSFMVSPSKQIAYCFGCHRWGWAVKFIMDIENCEFKEALEILWNYTGIKVNANFDEKKFQEKKSLYWLYKDATNYYKEALKSYPEIKKYLYDRWLNEDIIREFSIGYSDSWVELYNYLKNKWYDDSIIENSAIFLNIRSKKDKFINRIIFPIRNSRWDFIAFAGRIIHSWEPKYLNSPASNIYDKSNVLYNLFNARNAITKEDFVIICEWYMDVIGLYKWWFFNAVSVSGTALTDKHITLLKRLTKKIYICFDGDKAWENATKLSLEKMQNKDLEVKIISLPKWKDPDDIITSGKDFSEYIKNALSPIAYFIKKSKFDTESIDDKKKILSELLEIIKSYSDNIEKDFYLKEVSKLLDIHQNIVYDSFNKIRFSRTKENSQTPWDTNTKEITYEDLVLAYCLFDEKNIEFFKESIVFSQGMSKSMWAVFEKWTDFIKSLSLEQKEKLKWLSVKLEIDAENTNSDINEELKKVAFWLNKEIFTKKISILKEKMNSWDNNALLEYSEVMKQAKSIWLK